MPLTALPGVGTKRAALFEKLGVDSAGALLRLYPRAYEDWSNLQNIAGSVNNSAVCIRAEILQKQAPVRIRGGMMIFKLVVSDGSDNMVITYFNQQFLYDKIRTGEELLFYGTVRNNGFGYEMGSPAFAPVDSGGIRPVYPQTAGLSTKQIEAAVRSAFRLLPPKTNDPLPDWLLKEYGLCSLDDALRFIHFPESFQQIADAKRRLAFEELLVLQLGMAMLKGGRGETECRHITRDYTEQFIRLLPFSPTGAQKRAVSDCINDMMNRKSPMNRLVQGDVGSGKTAVAAAVCYTAIKNGMQCAFMAPTEILAAQHFRSLSSLLSETGIRVALLTGSSKALEKRNIYSSLESGEIDLVIGTHALISEGVSFRNLGLVITDEQHRFGVAQRSALISKGSSPHIMVMSATPIPRTLALMIFGDLDISVLDELPPGRQRIDTYLINSEKRARAYGFLHKQIKAGNQCYIVCPLVGQNESELESAEEYVKKLGPTVLGSCRIGLLHGKMKPKEKDAVMAEFSEGRIDILVSTTVIEVGVDVPNASVMMIENAERFGLSQLHQLRGRVGRGKAKSYCILVSDHQGETTRQRLSVMCQTNDGFKIADEDLRLRGPGDFFGLRQHGLPELKTAGISDMQMLDETRSAAERILSVDPGLSEKEHRGLLFETKRLFARAGGEQLQ